MVNAALTLFHSGTFAPAPSARSAVILRKPLRATLAPMPPMSLALYLNPWKLNREKRLQRLNALRQRDGDDCRRCRRPMRFDLPRGHDQGATVEAILPNSPAGRDALDNLCLTHRRCNAAGADHTDEVSERMRRRNEAALLSRPRKKAAANQKVSLSR